MILMNAPNMLLLFMVVLLNAGGVAEAEDDEIWAFQAYIGEDYTLQCKNLNLSSQNYIKWLLPGSREVPSGEKYVYGDYSGIIHFSFTIRNVQKEDSGVYLCQAYSDVNLTSKEGELILRGLNLGGPLYLDQFDEYRDSVMIGGIAAACLFVPFAVGCLVYKYRYQSKEDRAEKKALRLKAKQRRQELVVNGKGTELPSVEFDDSELQNAYTNIACERNESVYNNTHL